ncbi:MAG: aminotransferase class I/II-fold pyridoxal phosphate-dependent enzyme [Bacteroidetes bacterium]|nr:MAG: aminotransferase class I/II-fold pyridoxal phosphate-dependent enzyme [Bacteroidota bacterium]
MIELRSDTFTQPTSPMLDAMMQAKVGDDVFMEDETVLALEAQTAAYFGMPAGLFCPSGTMTNQIAIKCHTQPGQEVICDELSHIYQYEAGGIAFNSGCSVRLLHGEQGRLTAAQVENAINPNDIHKAPSSLVSLENTVNRGGGACYNFAEIERIADVCRRHGLPLHLDGARLWNALVAKPETALQYGQVFHSISVCYSKGMGAPVGSVLLGDEVLVQKARRIRKVLGGGMRQAGYLAAACLYALENHLPQLAIDHAHAQATALVLAQQSWVAKVLPVETNIVIFELPEAVAAATVVEQLKAAGVLVLAMAPQAIRMVFHLGVASEAAAQLNDTIVKLKL